MIDSSVIHWEEGLLLQPQHLQLLQRQMQHGRVSDRRTSWPYDYGVVESKIVESELVAGRVCFEKLKVVTPSGRFVAHTENALIEPLPVSTMELAAGGGSRVVVLAIPNWRDGAANASGTASRDRTWTHVEEQVCDENTGLDRRSIRIRRLNAHLRLDGATDPGVEIVPLIRVRGVPGSQVLLRDREFSPPCLVIRGCDNLCGLTRGIVSDLRRAREAAYRSLQAFPGGDEALGGAQVIMMMRLMTLSSFAARLAPIAPEELDPAAIPATLVSPFEISQILNELLAALEALKRKAQVEVVQYLHKEPFDVFRKLWSRLQQAWAIVSPAEPVTVPFVFDNEFLTARLEDARLFEVSSRGKIFLNIRLIGDRQEAIRRFRGDRGPDGHVVPDVRLLPFSLIGQRLNGLQLIEHPNPIPTLPPPDEHSVYFTLDLEHEATRKLWQFIGNEKRAGFGALKNPTMRAICSGITLYAPFL